MRRRFICLVALSGLLALSRRAADAAQEVPRWDRDLGAPAPELLAAGWVGSPVSLRAVKGNTVLLLFWNPDLWFFDESLLADVVRDYEKYRNSGNITFVSISTSMTATLKSLEKQVEQYKLRPFPTLLDAGGATARAYKVPPGYASWLVVLDGDGNFAYNSSKGWYWAGGPDTGKFVHHTQIEASLKRSPGILDRSAMPREADAAAHFFDLQQFSLAEGEIRRLEKSRIEDSRRYALFLKDTIAQTRKKRLAEIEELSSAAPVQAYREAVAFVASFAACPEKTAMNEIGKTLLLNPAVKKELQAEDAYRRILLPELKKTPKGSAEFEQRVQPLLTSYLKVYGGTEYAQAVVGGVENYKLSAARSR